MRRPTQAQGHAMRAIVTWLLGGMSTFAGAGELSHARPCTWNRPPNYAHCTDSADVVQLTDGLRAANDYIWLDRATVGWELAIGDIVTWSLDLGSECDLDSVVVRSAWFERSGIVPPSLLCAVGDAPNRLQWAGGLDGATLTRPDSSRPARVSLVMPLPSVRGRWVLVAALLRSNFLCTDEIEVHGAAPTTRASVVAAPGSPLGRAFAPTEIDVVYAVQRRLWSMRAALPNHASAPLDDAHGWKAPSNASTRIHLDHPAAAEENARLASRARSWRTAGIPALEVRRVDPWAATTPWSELQVEMTDTLELWPGAWGAAAIEIAAAGDSTVQAALRVTSTGTGAPRAILREVVYVEARDGRWVGDALPLAPAAIVAAPGAVRQVWIDVDARLAAPGMHHLRIEVGGRTVSLAVRVHDVRVSARQLSALDWTYPTKFALTRRVPEVAVRDNREHGIDSWCLSEESVPWPDPATIDAEGHINAPLDFAACDRDLSVLTATPARRIVWYWDFAPRADDPSRGRFRHPYLSRAWRVAVSEWLDAWLTHLDALGHDGTRIVMQPVDEASSPAVLELYRTLRKLHPGLPLALTLTRNATSSELRALEPHLTLAIIERRALAKNSKWIARARRRGIEVWTYDVLAPSKTAAPLADYRLLAWEAWGRSLAGCAFWAYGDTGPRSADAWNDFDEARWDHAVVYGESGAPRSLGGESLVPSKRWQAFRMGLDDTAVLAAAVRHRPGLRAEVLAGLRRGRVFDPDAARKRLLRLLME